MSNLLKKAIASGSGTQPSWIPTKAPWAETEDEQSEHLAGDDLTDLGGRYVAVIESSSLHEAYRPPQGRSTITPPSPLPISSPPLWKYSLPITPIRLGCTPPLRPWRQVANIRTAITSCVIMVRARED